MLKLQRINNSVWNPSIDLAPLSIGQDALTLAVALQAKTVPEVTFCYCLFIRSHGVTRKHKASSICTVRVQPPYVCPLLLIQKKLFFKKNKILSVTSAILHKTELAYICQSCSLQNLFY